MHMKIVTGDTAAEGAKSLIPPFHFRSEVLC